MACEARRKDCIKKFKTIKDVIEFLEKEKDLSEIDYQKINTKEIAKRTKPYEDMTHYKTVKEFFMKSVKENADRPCILEKPSHKEPYVAKTYKEHKRIIFKSNRIDI